MFDCKEAERTYPDCMPGEESVQQAAGAGQQAVRDSALVEVHAAAVTNAAWASLYGLDFQCCELFHVILLLREIENEVAED